MRREDKLLSCIDKTSPGLEIGPSYNPIAPRSQGFNVRTIDHCSREDLVKKYANDPSVDTSRIEDVDYVWTGQPYEELVGGAKFGWIIASHVIEHTPDLVQFIRSCESVLDDKGVISLAVPDHRFCFDHFRERTSLAQVVDAHEVRRTNHSVGTAAEFNLNVVNKDQAVVWSDANPGGVFKNIHGVEQAKAAMAALRDDPDSYRDFHAWVFTPSTFRLIMHDLYELGYIKVREVACYPTVGCEFYVSYQLGGPGVSIDRLELQEQAKLETSALSSHGDAQVGEVNRSLSSQVEAQRKEIERLKRSLDHIHKSSSWRITRPLRVLGNAIRGNGRS